MPYNPITAAYKMPFAERNAHQWEVIRRYNAHDELLAALRDILPGAMAQHNHINADQPHRCATCATFQRGLLHLNAAIDATTR